MEKALGIEGIAVSLMRTAMPDLHAVIHPIARHHAVLHGRGQRVLQPDGLGLGEGGFHFWEHLQQTSSRAQTMISAGTSTCHLFAGDVHELTARRRAATHSRAT